MFNHCDVVLTYLQIIYTAKGANRTWAWLAMVSVCIFTLRDVIRIMQKNFKTPHNGQSHTSPSCEKDIKKVIEYLELNTIQTYTPNQKGNDQAEPVRDLLADGLNYANTATAFRNFRSTASRATYKHNRTEEPPESENEMSDSEDESEEDGSDEESDIGAPMDAEDIATEDEPCDINLATDIVTNLVNSLADV